MSGTRASLLAVVVAIAGIITSWTLRVPDENDDARRARLEKGANTLPSATPASAANAGLADAPEDAAAPAITDCAPVLPSMPQPQDPEKARAEYQQTINDLRDLLAKSPDAEHLHAAALLERDPARRIAILGRALVPGHSDAFLAWTAVNSCTRVKEPANCPLEAWEARLLALDSQNSEAWMLSATLRWRAGDVDAALRALRRAAASPESRVYWPEMLAIVERASAVGGHSFIEGLSYAFGAAAMNGPDVGSAVRMCRAQSSSHREWAHACLAYGERVERQGRTMLQTSIARSIQRLALEVLEEEERLAAVIARQDAARPKSPVPLKGEVALESAMLHPAFFERYLDLVRTQGELAGRESLLAEWQAWLLRQQATRCLSPVAATRRQPPAGPSTRP